MELSLQRGADLVARGGVVVYPTETLWGIGGDATRQNVFGRVLAAKGISEPRPVPLLAASVDVALEIVRPVPGLTARAREFWPGGLTVVVPPIDQHLEHLVGPEGGLGVRVSSHPVATALAAAAGGLLLSTSANRTGEAPPRALAEVAPEVLAATDGAMEWSGLAAGLPSTLLIYDGGWRVARVGAVSVAALRRVLDEEGMVL